MRKAKHHPKARNPRRSSSQTKRLATLNRRYGTTDPYQIAELKAKPKPVVRRVVFACPHCNGELSEGALETAKTPMNGIDATAH